MKIAVYSMRSDERPYFEQIKTQFPVTLSETTKEPSTEDAVFLRGCVGVSILGQTAIRKELLDIWKECGIQYLSTRTIGYNHIDVAYANKIGIRVCNASYAPNGVADFTVMLMLMCLRNYKQALWQRLLLIRSDRPRDAQPYRRRNRYRPDRPGCPAQPDRLWLPPARLQCPPAAGSP